jgi:hypothetical protein
MEIGDKVKVVDGFEAYTNYSTFVKDNIPMLIDFYENGNVPKADNIVYEIIARWALKGGNKFIYGIYNNEIKVLYIISENGLKLTDKGDNKMKIGDKVKVKSWDELLKSGKETEEGNIYFISGTFLNNMRYYCGCECTVSEMWGNGFYLDKDKRYCFTEDMIENNSSKMIEKYVILDTRSGELVIEDNNPYFYSLEDAQDYVLECEESPQLLNILEVSKVFECELNFKEVK